MHAAPMHTLSVQHRPQRLGQDSPSIAAMVGGLPLLSAADCCCRWGAHLRDTQVLYSPDLVACEQVTRQQAATGVSRYVCMLQQHTGNSSTTASWLTSQVDLIVAHTVHVLWAATDEFCRKPSRQPWPQAACRPCCRGACCVHVAVAGGCCCLWAFVADSTRLLQTLPKTAA